MITDALFCSLSSQRIAELIRTARQAVCYAAPGIQSAVAQAMVEMGGRLGPEMLSVCLDFDERVMRMGYGDMEAVKLLREAGVLVSHAPGLRSALVIVDGEGFTFVPTPLYLEAEPGSDGGRNAMRLSLDQVTEALARLSPAAKAIAVAQAKNPEEKARIAALPDEIGATCVDDVQFREVDKSLKEAPPVKFDLARQVRVFEPYLQYVELNLSGAAIQRHRLAIPTSIQKLGGSKEIEGRLRTTFELIEKGSKLSSKPLEDELNDIRKFLTPSLGKDHGRVVLKAQRPRLTERLGKFREKLEAHRQEVKTTLQKHLDESRAQIVGYYTPLILKNPPDALNGQLLTAEPAEEDARRWLDAELNRVFPTAESLIEEMRLEERFKDVTFETLNREDFLESVKAAFPLVDWEKAYSEFRAAGESGGAKDTG